MSDCEKDVPDSEIGSAIIDDNGTVGREECEIGLENCSRSEGHFLSLSPWNDNGVLGLTPLCFCPDQAEPV